MNQEAWEIAYNAAVASGNKKKWELYYKHKAAEEMYAALQKIHSECVHANRYEHPNQALEIIYEAATVALDKAEGK